MPNNVFYYFKKSVAFFDLKAKSLPPVVFVVILALYSVYMYIIQKNTAAYNSFTPQNFIVEAANESLTASYPALFLVLIIILLINVVSFIYLSAAIKEAKNEDYTAKDCISATLRNFIRLTGVTILKNVMLVIGLMLFLIPGIILAIIIIFAECFILDRNAGVLAGLKGSWQTTKGRRGEIFKIELFCNLIIIFFVVFILNFFVDSAPIVFQYIFTFLLSLCSLIEHKLVAYLYVDSVAISNAANGGSVIGWSGYGKTGSGDTGSGETGSVDTGSGDTVAGDAEGRRNDDSSGPI